MARYNPNMPSAEDRAIDRFCDLLIEKLQSLQSDWKKPWLSAESQQYPRNMSGRPYAGHNALMLMLNAEKEGYTMPFYATFNRISALNFTVDKDGNHHQAVDKDGIPLPTVTVNKGAKSFPVFLTTYTIINKDTKEKIPIEEYRKLSSEERKNWNVYPKNQVFNVFNLAAQTNLAEARPELFAKLQEQLETGGQEFKGEHESIPVIDAMVDNQLWHCPIFLDQTDNCYYSLSRDEVHIVPIDRFKDHQSYVSTLLHECNHSVQAKDRLGILGDGAAFGSREYSDCELKAELGAALVCSRLGLSKPLKEDSAPYLKSWLDHIQEDPKYLKSILGDVKRQVAMVNERLDFIQAHIDAGTDLSALKGMGDRTEVDLTPVEEPVPFKRSFR